MWRELRARGPADVGIEAFGVNGATPHLKTTLLPLDEMVHVMARVDMEGGRSMEYLATPMGTRARYEFPVNMSNMPSLREVVEVLTREAQ